jgi:hypothetical protein
VCGGSCKVLVWMWQRFSYHRVDTQMKDFYVYGYVRSKDSEHGPAGSFYYIGKGKGDRKTSGQRTIPAPTDHGNIVTFSYSMSEPDAFQLEMLLIHMHGRIDNGTGCLRNLTDGGEGSSGYVHTEEGRVKMSTVRTGKRQSAQTVAKRVAKNIGKKRTPETKAKIGAANRGKKPSAETLAKLSAVRRGAKRSPEHLAKLIAGRKGKKLSPEHRAKIAEAHKQRAQYLKAA